MIGRWELADGLCDAGEVTGAAADLDWALKNLSAGWYQTNRSNDEVGQTNGIQMTDVAASCHAGLSQA